MLVERLKKIIEQNKERTAYIINDESISYGKLWKIANEYADCLKNQGTEPVVVFGHKDINMIVSIFACIIAGRTYVPIDISVPYLRIQKIINLTNSTLVIKNDDIEINHVETCTLSELSKYKNDDIKDNDTDIVYIIFTSGSTGEPKGVPISKDNLINFIDWISNLEPLSEYKHIKVLNQASFNFDLSVADIFYSLYNGHTLVGLDRSSQQDYKNMFKVIYDNEVNLMVITPTFMKLCLLNDEFNQENYFFLKCIYFCGEKLEVSLVQKLFKRFPSLKIINAYGPTEATSAISAVLINPEMLDNNILPVGDASYLATEVQIINNEIVLKGRSVFSGYLGNIPGGYYAKNKINCYKTGDFGYFKNGLLYCNGRIDRQVKYNGYRIELDEIEYLISKLNFVVYCAVVVSYSNDVVKSLKAFVVVNNKNIDSQFIKNYLKEEIPSYMIPKKIVLLDKLPVNNNGKIDRKRLENL